MLFQPENKDIDKIIIYGDVRSGYLTHIRIADMIYQEKPDMVIFTGDIASNSRNYIHYMQHTIFEKKLWDNGYENVAGTDEAGRGPLYGPVVAASVILPHDFVLEGLNDKQYEAVVNTEGPCLVIARCRKWKNKSINP